MFDNDLRDRSDPNSSAITVGRAFPVNLLMGPTPGARKVCSSPLFDDAPRERSDSNCSVEILGKDIPPRKSRRIVALARTKLSDHPKIYNRLRSIMIRDFTASIEDGYDTEPLPIEPDDAGMKAAAKQESRSHGQK